MVEEGLRVRGKLVNLWRDFAEAQFLPDQWDLFLAGLPPDSPWRAQPAPDTWVPYDQLWQALEALARSRPWDTYGTRGIAAAPRVFQPGFLPFTVPRSPEGLLRHAVDIWEHLYRGGRLEVATLLPQWARIRLDVPHPQPELYLIMLGGWFREALSLFGAREPEVKVAPDPRGGTLELSWKGRGLQSSR